MSDTRLFKCQDCGHEAELKTVFNFEVCPKCNGNFFPADYVPPVDWKARAEAAEATLDFHPRAAKLMQKRKKFIVIAEDEPYYTNVYGVIRDREIHFNRWTDEDEKLYRAALKAVTHDSTL